MSYNDYIYIASNSPKSLKKLKEIYGEKAVALAQKEIEEIQNFFDPELSDDQNDRWIAEEMLAYPKGIESVLEMQERISKMESEKIVPF